MTTKPAYSTFGNKKIACCKELILADLSLQLARSQGAYNAVQHRCAVFRQKHEHLLGDIVDRSRHPPPALITRPVSESRPLNPGEYYVGSEIIRLED